MCRTCAGTAVQGQQTKRETERLQLQTWLHAVHPHRVSSCTRVWGRRRVGSPGIVRGLSAYLHKYRCNRTVFIFSWLSSSSSFLNRSDQFVRANLENDKVGPWASILSISLMIDIFIVLSPAFHNKLCVFSFFISLAAIVQSSWKMINKTKLLFSFE